VFVIGGVVLDGVGEFGEEKCVSCEVITINSAVMLKIRLSVTST